MQLAVVDPAKRGGELVAHPLDQPAIAQFLAGQMLGDYRRQVARLASSVEDHRNKPRAALGSTTFI
jgi:hypothetical protein